MRKISGKSIIKGFASGNALVTQMPVNFTAAFSKPANLVPLWKSTIYDHHHDLYKQCVQGRVLVFPSASGSTYTGMMLPDLIYRRAGPAAMVVQDADSLLVSGSILAGVWFETSIPIVEADLAELHGLVTNGTRIWVNGDRGEILIDK